MPESTLYQTSSPADQVADLLGRLFDPTGGAGEGLYFGGAASLADLPGGTSYPAFLALVADDGASLWPCGDAAPTPIDFEVAAGTLSLYLVPFGPEELPSFEAGRIGAFSLIAASTAPADSLALGSGSVTDSAFTTWSEAAGVRRDRLAIGSGQDGDIVLVARNGDASQPELRYRASQNRWEFSNDGTNWEPLAGPGVTSFNGRGGAVSPESGDYSAAQVGAIAAGEKGAASGVASLDAGGKLPEAQLTSGVERTANKGQANGYAGLGADGQVPGSQLPAFGDVSGPASSVSGRLSSFADTTGKLLADSGLAAGSIARRAESPTSGHIASLDADGDPTDAGFAASDVAVKGPRGTYLRSSNLTLSNATDVHVPWQSRSDNSGLTWSSGSDPEKVTIGSGEAGQYLIVATAAFGANVTGMRRMGVVINSSLKAAQWTNALSDPDAGQILNCTWQGDLAEGDYVRLVVNQTSGGNLSLLYLFSSLRLIRLFR